MHEDSTYVKLHPRFSLPEQKCKIWKLISFGLPEVNLVKALARRGVRKNERTFLFCGRQFLRKTRNSPFPYFPQLLAYLLPSFSLMRGGDWPLQLPSPSSVVALAPGWLAIPQKQHSLKIGKATPSKPNSLTHPPPRAADCSLPPSLPRLAVT